MSFSNSHPGQLLRISHDLLDSIIRHVERWLPGIKIHQATVGATGTLSVLLASGALLYLWRSSRSCHSSLAGEKPPLVSYWIPWIGSAMRIQKDPDALVRKAHRELGPVFGVKIFGTVLYHVTDADLIASVYKQTKVFSSSPLQKTFLKQIYDLSMSAITGSDAVDEMLQAKNRHLSQVNVHAMISSFIIHTRTQVSSQSANNITNSSILLSSLVIPLMQKADCAMFFGSSFVPAYYDSIASAFDTFDTNIPLLAVNFPPALMPGTVAARRLLLNKLGEYFRSGPPDDASGFLKEFVEIGQGVGWSPEDLSSFGLGLMWPLLANAPYAVYWLLAFHLRRPEGLKPILDEIKAVLSSGRDLTDIVRDSDATPYLDACLNETIRLASDSYSVRWVPKPTADAESPSVYRLDRYIFTGGEQVVCNMRGVHMDESVYPHPEVFDPARFMGQEKEAFRGKFIPFGGGFSMCSGRHLAVSQIKAFIIILLSEFDVSLAGEQDVPRFSPSNRGFGMIRPVGDINVQVSKRKV